MDFFSKEKQKQNVKIQWGKKKPQQNTQQTLVPWSVYKAKILKKKTQAHIFVGDANQGLS